MNTLLRPLAAALVAALLWGLPQTAMASHFRFANLSWKRAPGTNSLAVEITVTEAWRSGSFGQGEIYYYFGDGSAGFTTAAATRIATLADTAGEEYEVWRYTTTHTYPSNDVFTVLGSSCCRISTLVNAADASESFQMVVDLRSTANTGSPVTTAPVILQMQAGTNNSIALPIVDPDGDAFTVRLATSAESSIFSLPTVGGNAISVTAGGVLNWNTVGGTSGQKFALQVIIEENRAGNTTGTNGRIPLDFIIELAGSLTNLPPTVTGTNGSITIAPNQRFTATFVGTDPEGGPLRVNHQGLPPGATITPADGTTNASPTSVMFSWTPAPSDVGSSYAVLIFFTDQGGLQRAASFALTVSAAAAVRDFELLSINSAGTASGSGASLNPVVSSNGQYVAFVSDAANLVANDNNGARDVFWRDRRSGTTRLVSRTAAGASGNGDSDAPVISPDGRYVAFHSRASNLTANDGNTNYDVFLWDAHDDSVTLVSRTASGASGAGDSFSPQLSASGRVVSFASTAADLVSNDTNGTSDAFARDLDLGVTYLASINTNGFSGNGSCGVPVLSANGRYVAFLSRAGDLVTNDTNALNDVFVHDLQTRVTTLVSVNVAGTGAGNRLSFDPVISTDGRYIAFASQATNLVTIPDNNNFPDTFVRDMQVGVTKLVSVNRFGTAAGGNGGVPAVLPASFTPFLNADGTKVLFVSLAQDLVANDTNGKQDVFLRDHVNNTTTLISVNRFGTGSGNAASGIGAASMSADLRYVAFFSEASNVGTADTNNKTDVFLRDLATNSTKIISRVNLGGFAASGHSFQPVISADGSTILFTSEADNLDNRDANGASDVFAAATTLGAPNFGIVDVAVSLTSVGPRTVGTPFTLTITVTNHSASPATGLVVGNSGPDFLQFVSASVSQGTVDATVLSWQVGDLAANGSATATVTLVATNLGAGNVVSSIIERDQLDANLNNNAALSTITANQTAAGALFYLPGNTAYLSRTNSPFFADILAGTVTLEDFESGAFNLLGITASVGAVIAPSASTDSVDADDGAVDGNGNGGHSFFVTGTNSVTFTFNPVVFGRLPTKVGIVLTDGDHVGSGIEAFDTNGVSLGVIGPFEIGDNSFFGETAEDRFLGVEFAGGISALRVIYAQPGFEVDHLQFDLPAADLQLSGTAPGSAIVGSNFVVTLSVTNLGPRAVTSAVVTNAEPGPISLLNAVATTGTFDPMTGRWNVGGLAVGAGATLTLTVAATNLGLVTFESRVLSEAVDPNPANNLITRTVPVPNQPPTLLLGFPASTNQVVESRGADYALSLLLPLSLTNVIALAPRGFLHTLAVQADHTVAVWGELNPYAPGDYGQTRPLPGLTNVSAVAAGFDHNLALLADGTVVAWGDNSYGQTNVPAGLTNVVSISSGQAFNVALKSDGTVVGWGRNTSGELAIPAGLGNVKAISAGGGHTLSLLSNSTVVAWGANGQGQATVPAGLSNVVAVSAGHLFSLALKSDGSVVGWGENGFGQASPPITISNATAIAAGFDNALALLANGAVVEWGRRSVTPAGFSSPAVNPAAAIATALSSAFLLGPEAFDPSVRVLQDSGLYSRSIIRTISPGPSGESNQSVTIFTTNANPAFFSVQPTVSSNGVLTFAPAAGVVGSVEVFFYAQDDGGDANGGTSTGQLERLTIYVLPVNHAPSLSLTSTQVVVLEDAGAQSLTGFVTPSVGPTNEQPQNIISYTVSSTNPGLFQSQPAIALDGTLTFTPATNANGSALVTVVAQDNGGVLNGGVDRTTNTFTIMVTNVNDAPVVTLAGNLVSVLEDSGAYAGGAGFASFSPGPADEAAQTLVGYTVSNNNNPLFSSQPAIDASGLLTFTPATNANGTATVTVIAQDSGGTADGGVDRTTNTFTITVTNVNDAPIISFTTNLLVALEDSGANTLTAFATFDPVESGQTITNVTATNSNPALFSVQPYFTTDGTLRFTPFPDSTGTGVVTVVIQDDGGTANGGVDKATNTFTLVLSAVNTAPSFALTNFPPTDGVQDWVRDAVSAPGAGRKVAVDGSGNVIVAGDYVVSGGEVGHLDLFLVKYNPAGTALWTNTYNTGFFDQDKLADLALDAAGNAFVLAASADSTTNFVTIKYLADGTPAWTNVFDSGADDAPAALALDASGNVFVTGAVPDPMSQAGHTDYLTIKYAADGTPLWTNITAYAGLGSDRSRAIAVDASGDVVVAGDGSNTDYVYAFTVKISGTAGTNLWTRYFSTDSDNNNSNGKAVAVDASGNVLMAADLLETGIYKLAVVKYNAAGDAQWTNTFTRSGVDATVKGLAVDGSGNAIVLGISYNGTDADFTTIKYDGATGNGIWTNHYDLGGQGSGDGPSAITVNAAGDVFVTGHSFATSGKDYLTIKYSAAGVGVWTNRYDSAGSMSIEDDPFALAVDTNGNVYVTGESDTVARTIKYAFTPSAGASQTVTNTVGAVNVPGFITSSSVGPANEAAQSLSFAVTNDNSALFTVQPAISAAGVLSYTVAPGVSGLAVVTVRAQDTGGTDNGGVDTSAPQSFNITVLSGSSAVFYVWLGGSGDWNDPFAWTPHGVPGVMDSASMASGTALLTNSVTVEHLTLDGGTLGGAGSLTIRSSMNWNGGVMSGTGAATIAAGATLAISGAAEKNLNRRLDNYGAVTWTDARITGDSAPVINNYAGATFHIQTDAALFESYGGGARTFNNAGTVVKTVATGTSSIQGTFNQNGTVDTRTGTINPTETINIGTSSFSGAGRFLVASGTLTLNGTVTVSRSANFEFSGGTIAGSGTIAGTLNWTGGIMAGPGTTTIAANGELVISGAAEKNLNRRLDNYGTVTWTGARITGDSAPVINNYAGALFDIQTDATLYESYSGGARTFNNSGALRKSAGTGTTAISGAVNNASTLNVQTGTVALAGGGASTGVFTNAAGAALQFTGGTHNLGSGARFTGDGASRVGGGVVSIPTNVTATVDGIFEVASGTLGGDGDLTVLASRTLNWTGGVMAGLGKTIIQTNATLTISGAAEKNLNRRLDNYGTVTWTDARITGDSGPVVNNFAGALFHVQTDSALFESYGGGSRTFNNGGTLRKSAATGISAFLGTFNNGGTVDVQSGTLQPTETINLNTSAFSGAGRFLVNGGALALGGTQTIASGANVEFAAGTLTGTGTIVGTLKWTGGVMSGPGTTTIAANGELVISGAAEKNLNRRLDNYGTVTWTGARITGDGGPVFNNQAGAVFDIQTDAALYESYGGGARTLNNAGTVRKSVGTGTSVIQGAFNNASLLEIRTGIILLDGGYAPGAASTLRVFLGGLTAGTQHGRLLVSGAATLDGALSIVLTNSFLPVAGNTFIVVSSGTRSGTFSAVTGDDLGGGLTLVSTYLLGDLTLTATQISGLPPLSPQVLGGDRLLRWANEAGGYALESAPSVNGPWTPVLAPVALENGDSVVRLTAEGTRFYRLVRPAPPRPGGNPTQ